MTDGILLHVADGLARVTFDRPASLNAMDFPMARRWREVAQQVTADPAVGAVILDATGPAFCAGGDVVAMATTGASGSEVTETAEAIHDGIRTFVEAPLPMVAAVQGAVAGGGLGLMLTADYVVASENARFVSRYANIGLTPDLGVSTLLPAAIGQRRALQLLLQDRMLDAAEAREVGRTAARIATSGEYQHGSIIIRREEDPSYRVAYDVTELENVAKVTKVMPKQYLLDHGGIAEEFQDYARPLVGTLRRPMHLSDHPIER